MKGRSARGALKAAYFRALSAARVDRLVRRMRARRGEVLVLSLHRVSPDPSPYWPPLTPEAFASLAGYLSEHCRVLTFAELPASVPDGRTRVVLSFDDGCRDFVEYAMPILARHRLRANHNVIVSSVETGRPPWIIQVMDALAAAGADRVRRLELPGFNHALTAESDRAKVRFGTLLANHLKAIPPLHRASLAHAIEELLRETPPQAFTTMMSVDDVRAAAADHEIGSHSHSHESMAGLSDEEFRSDFRLAAAFFDAIERPTKIYAFPNGSFRPSQIEWLLSEGVEHVLLVGERFATNLIGVHPRVTIYGDSPAELTGRALGLDPRALAVRNRG
jgi:peptidoglycan/xylan/chitin deacetylase (PgdA/CDA1 family)